MMDSVEVRLIRVGTMEHHYQNISSCVLMEGWSIEVGLNEIGRCRFKWLARSTDDLPPCLGDRIRVRNVTDGGPMAGVFSHEVFTGIVDRMIQTDSGYGANIWEVEVRQWPNIDRLPSGGASGGYLIQEQDVERFTIPAVQMEPGSIVNVTVWGSGGGGGGTRGPRGESGWPKDTRKRGETDGPKVVEEPGRRKIRKEEL